MELRETRLYHRLNQLSTASPEVDRLRVGVEQIWGECVDLAKTVVIRLPSYTLHDEVHLLRVVELMGRLIPECVFLQLRPLEIAALILAAGMHDLGMAISDQESRMLLDSLTTEQPTEQQAAYLAFRRKYPDIIKRKHELAERRRIEEAAEVESFLLAEYVRTTHASRSVDMIFDHFGPRCVYGITNYSVRIAKVCESHVADASTLTGLPCYDPVGPGGEYCNWRFVAVVLRLADILDFDAERTPPTLFRHLGVRETVSVKEWKKHQHIHAWTIEPRHISFAAECEDPVIQKTILDFITSIDREIANCAGITRAMYDPAAGVLAERYDLQLPRAVETRHIRPKEDREGPLFDFMDVQFRLDHQSILDLLMGLRLYGDVSLFLRELLQNATDACRHRLAREGPQRYSPQILVEVFEREGQQVLAIEDNGMGMNREIVETYFAKVGKSYYKSVEFERERAEHGATFRPVSQFGIGVLSAFMAGSKLVVESRRAMGDDAPLWVEIADEGALFWFRKSARTSIGTRLEVTLNAPVLELFAGANYMHQSGSSPVDDPTLQLMVAAVTTLAPHVEVPITVRSAAGERTLTNQPFQVRSNTYGIFRAKYFSIVLPGVGGLEGKIRFFLLVNPDGTFADRVAAFGSPFDSNGLVTLVEGTNYEEVYSQEFGQIHKYTAVRTDALTRQLGGGTMIHASGRWSQGGFSVPYALLRSGGSAPFVAVPFPHEYDLNVFGDSVLPLTADRKHVIDAPEARAKCDLMSRAITQAMLAEIGTATVKANADFFVRLAGLSTSVAPHFREAVLSLLGE